MEAASLGWDPCRLAVHVCQYTPQEIKSRAMPWRTSHHQSLLLVAYHYKHNCTRYSTFQKKTPISRPSTQNSCICSSCISRVLFVSGQDPCSFVCFQSLRPCSRPKYSIFGLYLFQMGHLHIFREPPYYQRFDVDTHERSRILSPLKLASKPRSQ